MIRSAVSFLTLILLPLLLGCTEQGDALRDSGGRVLRLSPWTPINPDAVVIRLAALESVTVTEAEEQIRDNSVVHQRIQFDGRMGFMMIQRAGNGFFHMSEKEEILSKKAFEKWLENSIKEKIFGLEEIGRIAENSRDRGGYIATFVSQSSGINCFVSRAGYKFNVAQYDNDFGEFDTIVDFSYCGPAMTYERFAGFLSKLTLSIGQSPTPLDPEIDTGQRTGSSPNPTFPR